MGVTTGCPSVSVVLSRAHRQSRDISLDTGDEGISVTKHDILKYVTQYELEWEYKHQEGTEDTRVSITD